MADLDDFFAKKDKKKSKVKKFKTPEDLVKKLEDTSKKQESSKSKTRVTGGNEEENQNQNHQEDEWKEYEEERKDYSGLKIGQLTLNDSDDHTDGEQGSEAQNDSEGNADAGGDGKSGPWKAVPDVPAPVAPPPPAQEPAQPKVYRPPALQSQLARVKLREMSSRTAPDLSNEEYFPTLGTAPPKPEPPKRRLAPGFEEVKHGSRSARPSEVAKSSPVVLGNRFHSLSGDAS